MASNAGWYQSAIFEPDFFRIKFKMLVGLRPNPLRSAFGGCRLRVPAERFDVVSMHTSSENSLYLLLPARQAVQLHLQVHGRSAAAVRRLARDPRTLLSQLNEKIPPGTRPKRLDPRWDSILSGLLVRWSVFFLKEHLDIFLRPEKLLHLLARFAVVWIR